MTARIAMAVILANLAPSLVSSGEALPTETVQDESPRSAEARPPYATAPIYELGWLSVTSGGGDQLYGTTYDLGLTAGENVSGFVSGTQFDMGFGFWYGSGLCPIALSGDVNLNGTLGTSDIITMVNFTLKAGPEPLPCVANGDSNCDGTISLSDLVVLINRVLKGGPDPCDACSTIPALWTCP